MSSTTDPQSNTDCDDLDASSYPGGTEVCDDADNDCDGEIDNGEDSGYQVWYADLDGDGFSAVCSGDCDDTSPAISPADYDSDGISTCQGDCNDFDDAITNVSLGSIFFVSSKNSSLSGPVIKI